MKFLWTTDRRSLTPPTSILIPAVLGLTVGVNDEYYPGEKYQNLYKIGILNASPSIANPHERTMRIGVIPLVLYWWCQAPNKAYPDTDIGWLHENIKAMLDAALNYRDPYRFERFMFYLLSIEYAVERAEADPTKPIHTWQVITMPPADADNGQFPPSHYAFHGLRNSETTLPAGSYLPGDRNNNKGFDFAIYEPGKMLKLYECKFSATQQTRASQADWEDKISLTVKQLAPALPGMTAAPQQKLSPTCAWCTHARSLVVIGCAPDTINRLFDQDVTGHTERKLSYTLDITKDQVHLEFLSLQSEPPAFREPAAASAAPQTDEPAANAASKTSNKYNKPDRVTVQSKADIVNRYPQWRSLVPR